MADGPRPQADQGHVFYAIADERFFIGAVALVNSLRLTGHDAPIVILDSGLRANQVAFLERECTVTSIDIDPALLTVFSKPYVFALESERIVVMIDTDVIITASLAQFVDQAASGRICGFADHYADRWFAEWEPLLGLSASPRRQTYLNGSFVGLSMLKWRGLVKRWWETSGLVHKERSRRAFLLTQDEVMVDPIGFNEQDTWNALLMSEAPEGTILAAPSYLAPTWADRRRVCVEDACSLRCTIDGRVVSYLHCTGTPKPWQRFGLARPSYRAYSKLLPRVLLAEDVALRLAPSDLPFVLRGTTSATIVARVADILASGAYSALRVVPAPLRSRITHTLRTGLSRS